MPKETLESVETETGLGKIIISVYKYLRDSNNLLGLLKRPIYSIRKPREPVCRFTKRAVESTSQYTGTRPFFSYKNNFTDKEVRILTFNPAVKANKIVDWSIFKNVTLVGASWVNFGNDSNVQKDISATSFSGGTEIGGLYITATGADYLSIGDSPVIFSCLPGETITIVPITDANASDLYLKIRIEEIDI